MADMFIDINKLAPEGVTFDLRLELPDLDGQDGTAIPVREARLHGKVVPGHRGVELTGRLEGRLGLVCDRCLEPFDTELSTGFALTLVRDAIEFGVGEARLEEGDTSLFFAPEGKADYRTIAVEQIYLNLPLKPVCRPDCAGLCPTCGANRNLLECDCSQESVDPRLAALQAFKTRPRE